MRIIFQIFSIMAILFTSSYALRAQYSGGTGTSGDPYQIATTDDLIELSNSSGDWDDYFIQTADITFDENEQLVDWDGDGTADWDAQDQLGFSPIGNDVISFTGEYDGQGHTISNLFINRPAQEYVGLFRRTNNSTISNIGIVDCNITGFFAVGSLVGRCDSNSEIINCYSTGTLTGTNLIGGLVGSTYDTEIINCYSNVTVTGEDVVGGLVGRNEWTNSKINNSYSTGDVSGDDIVGGLVGDNTNLAEINNSYSTGNVNADYQIGGLVGVNSTDAVINNSYSTGSVDGNDAVGGLVGFNTAIVTNSFWNTDVYPTSAGGTGKTTEEMQDLATFTSASWDFDATWIIGNNLNNGYPALWDGFEASYEPTDTDNPTDGVINIRNIAELRWVSENSSSWGDDFEMDNDINAVVTEYWNAGAGFSPIGNLATPFEGEYDGQGNEISNLYINRPSQDEIGLFGRTNGSTISNIGIVDCDISGDEFVGGLVGYNISSSEFNNSYSTGSVEGINYVGGLVGLNNGSSQINNSYSTGSVEGNFSVGGLVGLNQSSSEINNSYSTGSVVGSNRVGGLVGLNGGSSQINNCYSTGSVEGTSIYVGGLVGLNSNSSQINNSYSTSSVEGAQWVGGLVGLNYNSSEINNSYSTSSVAGTSNIGGLVGENNLSTVNNSFWNIDIYATDNGIGTGKTTEEMKTLGTFTDVMWDFVHIWRINAPTNDGYPYFARQDPCQSQTFVDVAFNSSSPGWQVTQFDNLNDALDLACEDATINISNYTHTGNIDMTGYSYIVDDGDFLHDGNLSDGLIQTTGTGRLIQTAVQNIPRTFPITDGTNNFTVTITPTSGSTSGVLGVKLNTGKEVEGTLVSPMTFWDIYGEEDLDATVILRIDKAALGTTSIPANGIIRFWNGSRYQPIPTERVSIVEHDTYYIITITNMNYFNNPIID
ncbi:MAG: hypothetical protein KIT33_02085 [Candidatus Kapabacteria bacterium]|nr:hypothetical protein [Ignavibacteriota bacterium]MCW5883741.1 hypothetical protein [Candidatus Kapabacteria bacterium]